MKILNFEYDPNRGAYTKDVSFVYKSLVLFLANVLLSMVATIVTSIAPLALVAAITIPAMISLFIIPFIFLFFKPGVKLARVSAFTYGIAVGVVLAPYYVTFSDLYVIAYSMTILVFGFAAGYGYITKRNLSGIRDTIVALSFSFIVLALIGLFLRVPILWIGISLLGVVLSTLRVVYLMKVLKQLGEVQKGIDPIYGAFYLFGDFINIFVNILRILIFLYYSPNSSKRRK